MPVALLLFSPLYQSQEVGDLCFQIYILLFPDEDVKWFRIYSSQIHFVFTILKPGSLALNSYPGRVVNLSRISLIKSCREGLRSGLRLLPRFLCYSSIVADAQPPCSVCLHLYLHKDAAHGSTPERTQISVKTQILSTQPLPLNSRRRVGVPVNLQVTGCSFYMSLAPLCD